MEQKKEMLEEDVQTDEYIQYAIAFEKNLSLLEREHFIVRKSRNL